MRTLTDEDGRRWDVVVGRESWGALYAIFIPEDGAGARQSPLRGVSYGDAGEELAGMDETELRELLGRSVAKES